MITFENRFFPIRSVVCFLVEGGIIVLSVLISFSILHIGDLADPASFASMLSKGILVAFICQTCMYMLDLYDLKNSQTWGEMFFSLLIAVGVVCIAVGLVFSVVPRLADESQIYILSIFFFSIFLFLWRMLFDFYLARLAPRVNILIVGTGEAALLVEKELIKRRRFGFRLIGFIDPRATTDDVRAANPKKILGNHLQMDKIVEEHRIHKIVVAITERRGEYPVKEMLALRVYGCDVLEWPHFFEKLSGRIPIDNLSPSYFIFNEGFRKSKYYLAIRRIYSTIVSAAALVLLLPMILVVAILIKIDSPGPVFYSQERVGEKGKRIRIHKFRSMRKDAEKNGDALWAVKKDPRVTRIGRILRKYRIDELPQLLNVLKGELDFVGPRPERPEFVEKLQSMIPYYSLRHTVKPGITGWAQVMFMYSGTIEESKEKLQYDLFYIKNMSLKLDLMILFQTMKIVLLGRGSM